MQRLNINICLLAHTLYVHSLVQNLIEKPEKSVADLYASQMIHFKILRVSNNGVNDTSMYVWI